jgi:ABC-2 type transport system ATP-binding protein
MTDGALIDVESLGKSFGEIEAVRDLSFLVPEGSVVGLLGPNGAGKTTTVNMLTTLLPIDTGSASIGGHDVSSAPDAVRRLIGLAGQSAAVDEKLTGAENLQLFCRLYRMPKAQRETRVAELIDRFDLAEFADRPVSTYSGGQRRRLDVVAALVASPPALFLDEPTTGLDPRSRSDMWEVIEDLRDSGTAILLTTQYLEEADRLANTIIMLDHGGVVARGTSSELKRDLGRDVLEVHVAASEDLTLAMAVIGDRSDLTVDQEVRSIRIPVAAGGAESPLEVLRRLDQAKVGVVDFQLRRPTLDDVFLAVTGNREDAR